MHGDAIKQLLILKAQIFCWFDSLPLTFSLQNISDWKWQWETA